MLLAGIGWLGREDAPLLFRPRAEWAQWIWGARFLIECLPGRTRRNTEAAYALAHYSREKLRELRRDTGIAYDHLERGILHFYVDRRDFEQAKIRAGVLAALRPGVTEVYVHPAVDTPELRGFAPDWEARVDDHRLMTADPGFADLVERSGAHRIGFRALRDLQRAG